MGVQESPLEHHQRVTVACVREARAAGSRVWLLRQTGPASVRTGNQLLWAPSRGRVGELDGGQTSRASGRAGGGGRYAGGARPDGGAIVEDVQDGAAVEGRQPAEAFADMATALVENLAHLRGQLGIEHAAGGLQQRSPVRGIGQGRRRVEDASDRRADVVGHGRVAHPHDGAEVVVSDAIDAPALASSWVRIAAGSGIPVFVGSATAVAWPAAARWHRGQPPPHGQGRVGDGVTSRRGRGLFRAGTRPDSVARRRSAGLAMRSCISAAKLPRSTVAIVYPGSQQALHVRLAHRSLDSTQRKGR